MLDHWNNSKHVTPLSTFRVGGKKKFCDIGSDRNLGSVWPMAFVSFPPFFCNIVYNLSNFAFYTELNVRLPIVMIIKQLLDARVINFVQQTLTSSVTHETIDRLLRKIANHKIMIVEPKLKRTLFRSHF